jgi:hypothetical protein
MVTNPERFFRRDTARHTLLGRPARVDSHEVRPLSVIPGFEQRGERPPRGGGDVAGLFDCDSISPFTFRSSTATRSYSRAK